jgi:hypothetical protein
LDFSDPLWISEGQLLLRERESRKHVALSGLEERSRKYPAAPFTEGEFEILGADIHGNLVALFDSKFWTASPSGESWSELSLSP